MRSKNEKKYCCEYCNKEIKSIGKYGEDAGGKYTFNCAIMRGPHQEFYLHNKCINPKIEQIDKYWENKKDTISRTTNGIGDLCLRTITCQNKL